MMISVFFGLNPTVVSDYHTPTHLPTCWSVVLFHFFYLTVFLYKHKLAHMNNDTGFKKMFSSSWLSNRRLRVVLLAETSQTANDPVVRWTSSEAVCDMETCQRELQARLFKRRFKYIHLCVFVHVCVRWRMSLPLKIIHVKGENRICETE